MESAQSAVTVENAVRKVPGVLDASVAYASERLVIAYDHHALRLETVKQCVAALGYRLEVPEHGMACSAEADAHHASGLAPKLEIPFVLVSGALIAAGWALGRVAVPPVAITICYAVAMATGGAFAIKGTLQSLRQFRVDIESLMVVAAIGAALLGAWFEGAFLLFLFALGHALEHRAMERARRAVEALGKLRPTVARVRRGADVVEVPVESVQRGDIVVVRPGDRVPVDGVVREGRTSIDQAAVTGESIPVTKQSGDDVFTGTINTDGAIEVEVTRISSESVLAKIVDLVSQAEAVKSPSQRFAQRLEQRFVPIVLIAAVVLPIAMILGGWTPKESVLRAVSLLVAASPCALAISTPAAVLSAVAAAARGGVLMKGGAYLEILGRVSSMAFDKTGTLTEGKPKLISASPAPDVTEEELLRVSAGVEALSQHPVAKAIVDAAKARGISPSDAGAVEAVHGKGIRATVASERVSIGSLDLFEGQVIPDGIRAEVDRLQSAGQTTMVVHHGVRWLGVLGVADTLRHNAKETIAQVKALGIVRTVMLSGDNQRVARAIADQVGIDDARAPLMPEGKVLALREMSGGGGVAMVGDGVNDAPALAAASVGVSMGGAGSDVALETADVVLMSDDLGRLPFAVGLARKASAVIRQNLVISIGVSVVLIVATVAGWAQISHAVILHEGSTLLVVANGLRLLAVRPGARSGVS